MQNSATSAATIKRTSFPDSSLVSHLEYNGTKLIVTFKKNGKVYHYPMSRDRAMSIFEAPSAGKAVLAMTKEITGELIEDED